MVAMVRAPCCEKVGLKRGRWTSEEDDILTKYIQANGEGYWRSVPKNAGLLRCGKSCRLRWINYLRPDLKRGNFSDEEQDLIIRLHASMGNRWSLIARHLNGRTDNDIKNYWNSHLFRKPLTDLTSTTGKAEVIAEWKLKRGRSRQRTGSENVTVCVPVTDMNQECDLIVIEKGMQANANEDSFQIIEEGEDNTPSLNAEKSLIFNQDHSDFLFPIEDALSVKTEENEADVSTHNSNMYFPNQKIGIKQSNEEVVTFAKGEEAWADWDWKSLVNGPKLIEEDEILSMLMDDGSDSKLRKQ